MLTTFDEEIDVLSPDEAGAPLLLDRFYLTFMFRGRCGYLKMDCLTATCGAAVEVVCPVVPEF